MRAQPTVLAVEVLLEAARLEPVGGLAGGREDDEVREARGQGLRDVRPEQPFREQRLDGAHLRDTVEQLAESCLDFVQPLGQHVQEEVAARPCRRKRLAVGADLEVLGELRPDDVHVRRPLRRDPFHPVVGGEQDERPLGPGRLGDRGEVLLDQRRDLGRVRPGHVHQRVCVAEVDRPVRALLGRERAAEPGEPLPVVVEGMDRCRRRSTLLVCDRAIPLGMTTWLGSGSRRR